MDDHSNRSPGKRETMPRPLFEPTAEQRKTVEAMAGYGLREDQIARCIGDRGIDPKTLRKHFRWELDTGATKANTAVAQTAYRMATSGKCPAMTIFWLKCRGGGWHEKNLLQQSGSQGGPEEMNDAEIRQRITQELARVAAAAKRGRRSWTNSIRKNAAGWPTSGGAGWLGTINWLLRGSGAYG